MGKHIQLPTHGTHGIGAYLAQPKGEPRGGIVVIQEIFGVNQHMRHVTDRFAAAGYVAIAPCFFDHIEPGIELAYTNADMEKGKKLVTELGLERAVEDVANAEEALSAMTARTGTVGFCWGGTVALLSAIRLGLPSVSYYGARNVQFLGDTPKAPVMFHFGEEDQGIPPDMVSKHRDLLPNMQVFTYPGAGHAFDRDIDPSHYHEAGATLARQRTMAFFDQYVAGS